MKSKKKELHAKILRKVRKVHRTSGALLFLFFFIVAVTGLLLEHYPNMTEVSIRKIAEDASTRWDLLDIVIVHRVGHLELGDQIVMVLVGSAHRPDAFDACEYIMDYLKTEAIFWKKEFRGESSHWIKSTSKDYQRRDGWE